MKAIVRTITDESLIFWLERIVVTENGIAIVGTWPNKMCAKPEFE